MQMLQNSDRRLMSLGVGVVTQHNQVKWKGMLSDRVEVSTHLKDQGTMTKVHLQKEDPRGHSRTHLKTKEGLGEARMWTLLQRSFTKEFRLENRKGVGMILDLQDLKIEVMSETKDGTEITDIVAGDCPAF